MYLVINSVDSLTKHQITSVFLMGLICGIFVMSGFAVLAVWFDEQKKDRLATVCLGPVAWILTFGFILYEKLRPKYKKWYKKTFKKALLRYPANGVVFYCNTCDADMYIKKYGFEFLPISDINGRLTDFWTEEEIEKKKISMRAVPRELWKRYSDLTIDDAKRLRREYCQVKSD